MKLLQRFILDELAKRGLSARQFAKECGVAASTISDYASGEGKHEPTLKSLRDIAKYTGVPLNFLIALAYPEVAAELNISPQIMLLARQLSELSEAEFNLIERLMRPAQDEQLLQSGAQQ